jgi:hypothetical protein
LDDKSVLAHSGVVFAILAEDKLRFGLVLGKSKPDRFQRLGVFSSVDSPLDLIDSGFITDVVIVE